MRVAGNDAIRMKKRNVVAIAAVSIAVGALRRVSGGNNAGSGGKNRNVFAKTIVASGNINGVISVQSAAIETGSR